MVLHSLVVIAVHSTTAGEMASTLSHVMVTNPTKNILSQTQSRLADIISEAQRNFSKLVLSLDPHSRCRLLYYDVYTLSL